MNYRESITINGKNYSKIELFELVQAKLKENSISEFEKSLYSFIREWIADDEIITSNTSGTTGAPKTISFRKEQAIASAKMTCDYFGLNKNTNALLCLSPEYIAGKMMLVRAFVSGINLIVSPDTSNPLININTGIDFAAMVPLQVENCMNDAGTRDKFQTITNVIIGGAPISHQLGERLSECNNNVYSTFSMTETLSHVALRKISGAEAKDYYEGLAGINFSIDERGCLIINAPKLNDLPVVTNDVVEIINPAHFRWLGRYDNVINSGGIKIYPEILERKLSTILSNNQYFISSLRDEKLGQKVVMVVENASLDMIKNVAGSMKNILSKYEIPKEYYVADKFIETATGKIKKEESLQISIRVL